MARCSLFELNKIRKKSVREKFISKIFFVNLLLNRLFVLGNCDNNYTPCSSRMKKGTAVIETTVLCSDEIALRVGEVY